MIAAGGGGAMSFEQALQAHLQAIRSRDLAAFAATLAGDPLLVTADGRVVRGRGEVLEMHRGWFAMDNWTLDVETVQVRECGAVGLAVLKLVYAETPERKEPIRQESVLTLVFQDVGGDWLMVFDQNTPLRRESAG